MDHYYKQEDDKLTLIYISSDDIDEYVVPYLMDHSEITSIIIGEI